MALAIVGTDCAEDDADCAANLDAELRSATVQDAWNPSTRDWDVRLRVGARPELRVARHLEANESNQSVIAREIDGVPVETAPALGINGAQVAVPR